MDFLTNLLFESPLKFGALAILVCGTLLVMWRRTGSDGRKNAFLGALAISLVLLVVQSVVVTDRETITGLLCELASATEKPDLAAIEGALDDTYALGPLTRKTVMPAIQAKLTRNAIERPRLWNFTIDVRGDEATAHFNASCDLRTEGALFPTTLSEWRVKLVRRETGWKIQAIEALRIAGLGAGGLGELR